MTPRQSALLAVGHFGLVLLALLVLCLSGCRVMSVESPAGVTSLDVPWWLLWTAVVWAVSK